MTKKSDGGSLWDTIFGVVGGPAAMAVDHSANTRGAAIGTIGGLGGTAIEAAAGDSPQALKSGVLTDEVLGSIAATVGTLGAAAPAATAGVAASDAAIDTGAAAAPAITATPTIAAAAPAIATPAATTAATTETAASLAAPISTDVSTAAAPISTDIAATPIAASSTEAPDVISGAGSNAITTGFEDNPQTAVVAKAGATPPPSTPNTALNIAKKATENAGKSVVKNIDASQKTNQDQSKSPTLPTVTKTDLQPQIKPDIGGNNTFDAIFGDTGMQSEMKGMGVQPEKPSTSINPYAMPSPIKPIEFQPIQKPRSIQDFLAAIEE